MHTRLRFKVIAILIIFSVVALVAFQGYWLKGLYDSIWETTQLNIKDAMKMADYKELFLRMERIRDKEGDDTETRTIEYYEKFNQQGNDSTTIENTEEKEDHPYTELDGLLSSLETLESKLLETMHETLDGLHPIIYSLYDSLLVEELKAKNIYADYTLRVLDTTVYIPIEGATYFDYPIQTQEEQFYRLYIHSPGRTVLKQMAGILCSSGMLLLLIIIAFIYLLRTILKQKTVEELKTDFTNNVTHELKTPIAVAFAANDVLLNYSEGLNEKQRKYLSIIKEQLSRLTGMVEQILTLSVENRATFKLNPEPVKVAELLPSLMEQHKLKTDKKLIFNIEVPDHLIIHTDRAHLYNMISNLIENAVKYTHKDEVHITVKALEKSSKESEISVSDNGIGINEANQKRVFDKYYRVPHGNLHNVKGYGLGLYYIKDLMTKQNGSVSVSSQPGKGSTFTLHFKKV